ncbi:LRP1B [Branchiostoma lanceolatum]|uniref:LRP1B protein n=1 Tax=Branchiostoma lanceolatum TaxID=7740 RepID=A0A8K0EL38_BRALA|nr:LRP1B [Branchiostoma lanceolatum]
MATGLFLIICLLSIDRASLQIETECPDFNNFFMCQSSFSLMPCIDLEWLCDEFPQCDDGSDEEDCWSVDCPGPDYFRCESTGACIPPLERCNGWGECVDGSDEKDCWSVECPEPDDYRCESNGLCVRPSGSVSVQCDGWLDCEDGSDEEGCVSKECIDPEYFKCESDGACIPPNAVCDDYPMCEDGSDERDCWGKECPESDLTTFIRCETSGRCIDLAHQCNGWAYCDDGSDEVDCWSKECPNADDFRCESDGRCMSLWWVCNGYPDCEDGSDEVDCWSAQCPNTDDLRCESDVRSCKPPWAQCDGKTDCPGGEDEQNCWSKECYFADSFRCAISGSCVLETKRCDGISDCDDKSDESSCVCTRVEFRCENSERCVAPSGVCDGVTDCHDALDELHCQSCIEKGQWQCDSGECIKNASVCDGDKDCSSGSDEENCHTPCNGLQLECDGRCLPKYRACDGLEDCSNGTDEINCTDGGCSTKQFRCANGSCLLESQLCDNLTDCSGGEDEDNCGDVPPPGFPLGLASRYIPDVFITASSEYKSEFAAFQARHTPPTTPGYCWVPSSVVDQWLQVYFGKTTDVTGVVISGGGSNWDLGSWVTSFTLAFSIDGASWAPYEGSSNNVQVFRGNRDRFNKVSRPLPTPVTSRYIRLYPTGYEGWVAMVMEVYVTNDEDLWLAQDEYVPLGVGLDPDHPAAVPKIPEFYMTASSRRNDSYPWLARLNNGKGQQQGACWTPNLEQWLDTGQLPNLTQWSDTDHRSNQDHFPDTDQWQGDLWTNPDQWLDTDQWLQIYHGKFYTVAGVITQGAYNMDHWVTSYRLAFSGDGQTWTPYTDYAGYSETTVFQGNNNNHRYARNLLSNPVFAVYTRFYPVIHHHEIALRVEILVIDEIESQFIPCENDVSSGSGEDPEVFHETQACDGTEDCSTGKDEANCDDCAMECLTDLGDPCIPGRWICDDFVDCLYGKDEQGCVQGVPKHCFFTCLDNVTCLPTPQLGDGHRDCAFGEDESPSDVEDALERKWGSCSYNCASVYGNASCVPDAFRCDGDADCLEDEDELGCEGVVREPTPESRLPNDCPTFTCDLPAPLDPICVPHHQICDEYPDCAAGEDEQGCGMRNADGVSTQSTRQSVGQVTGGPTDGREPTEEPTSGHGAYEDQTVGGSMESHGSQDQAVVWMLAAALVGLILFRLTF